MVLFISGMLASIAFLSLLGVSYWLGTKHSYKANLEPITKDKAKEQADKAEAMQKILNYDIGMAYKAKREGAK